ncbi:MAG: hypothetical protein HRT41_08970 [Campylobacteraceae bacterium]|nr:hypothetical protein [Campylobacteraceae bacterium]
MSNIYLQYFRNIIGIILALIGLYLVLIAELGTYGSLFFLIGIFMVKGIKKDEK